MTDEIIQRMAVYLATRIQTRILERMQPEIEQLCFEYIKETIGEVNETTVHEN